MVKEQNVKFMFDKFYVGGGGEICTYASGHYVQKYSYIIKFNNYF
jgi:hypothetical protein